jgi:putative membrane protein
MKFLLRLIISTLAVCLTAYLLPGVEVANITTAVIVAAVLTLLNTFLKPVLVVLTIPVTVVTLGIFLLIINAGMVILTSRLVPGFVISGFWSAFFFSIILSLITSFLESIDRKSRERPTSP